jgi:Cytochrome c oxidase subunit IV
MRVEGLVFSLFALFAGGVDVVYWFLSKDPTGTAALALCAGLGALIGSYLLFTGRRVGMRPQDLPDAEIADGAGELGHFSPGSYFPFFIAASSTLVLTGFVFGIWLSLIGGFMTVAFVTCLVFEYFVNPVVPD